MLPMLVPAACRRARDPRDPSTGHLTASTPATRVALAWLGRLLCALRWGLAALQQGALVGAGHFEAARARALLIRRDAAFQTQPRESLECTQDGELAF